MRDYERLPKVSFRSYRDEDYDAVCGFLIELNQKDRTHINWNWARFEWMMVRLRLDMVLTKRIKDKVMQQRL